MTNGDTERELLIDILSDNLAPLRAISGLTQAELADCVGLGRQTLISIENKRSRMRWDTCLAIILTLSQHEKTNDYLAFLGIDSKSIQSFLKKTLFKIQGGTVLNIEKIWTDYDSEYTEVSSICPLPQGIVGSVCPKCGSDNIVGAIITKDANESDPNILCMDCGYWRD